MLILTFLLSALQLVSTASAIWPLAVESEFGNRTVWLSPDFQVLYIPSQPREVIDMIRYFIMCNIRKINDSRPLLTN